MNEQNLVTLSPTKARELGRKGGQAKTEKKSYALLENASREAKCKNCRAECPFKKDNMKSKRNHVCTVPEARAKAIWYNMPVMCEEILDKIGTETLMEIKRLVASNPTKNNLLTLHHLVESKKSRDYPKVQRFEVDKRTVNITYEDMKEMYDECRRDERRFAKAKTVSAKKSGGKRRKVSKQVAV